MAELTDEEKKKIYEEEKARLEAQEKLKKEAAAKKNKNKGIGCLAIIILIAVVVITDKFKSKDDAGQAGTQTSASSSAKVAPPTADEERMMASMLEAKLVDKIVPEFNEAYVNPLSWAVMKVDEKEKVAWFLAKYCGKKKGTGLNWVEIKDAYSGKNLAKYSEAWGFKVY